MGFVEQQKKTEERLFENKPTACFENKPSV
jgi:hypothetical protein